MSEEMKEHVSDLAGQLTSILRERLLNEAGTFVSGEDQVIELAAQAAARWAVEQEAATAERLADGVQEGVHMAVAAGYTSNQAGMDATLFVAQTMREWADDTRTELDNI